MQSVPATAVNDADGSLPSPESLLDLWLQESAHIRKRQWHLQQTQRFVWPPLTWHEVIPIVLIGMVLGWIAAHLQACFL